MMKSVLMASLVVLSVGALAAIAIPDAAKTEGEKSVAKTEAVKKIESNEIQRIDWTDLTPPLSPEAQQAAVELNLRIDQMTETEVSNAMQKVEAEGNTLITELDDKNIELEGYLVPLDFNAETVTDFVMVPYFGACLHVPAPPPNQTVFVKFREGLAMSEFQENFYYPYKVQGKIKVARTKTDLAEVGYQVTASDIELPKTE